VPFSVSYIGTVWPTESTDDIRHFGRIMHFVPSNAVLECSWGTQDHVKIQTIIAGKANAANLSTRVKFIEGYNILAHHGALLREKVERLARKLSIPTPHPEAARRFYQTDPAIHSIRAAWGGVGQSGKSIPWTSRDRALPMCLHVRKLVYRFLLGSAVWAEDSLSTVKNIDMQFWSKPAHFPEEPTSDDFNEEYNEATMPMCAYILRRWDQQNLYLWEHVIKSSIGHEGALLNTFSECDNALDWYFHGAQDYNIQMDETIFRTHHDDIEINYPRWVPPVMDVNTSAALRAVDADIRTAVQDVDGIEARLFMIYNRSGAPSATI